MLTPRAAPQFWNFNGFTGAGLLAGEVVTPTKTIPKALLVGVLLVTFTYLLPLAVAAGVNEPPWDTWSDGSFSTIARNIGGVWLGIAVTVMVRRAPCHGLDWLKRETAWPSPHSVSSWLAGSPLWGTLDYF